MGRNFDVFPGSNKFLAMCNITFYSVYAFIVLEDRRESSQPWTPMKAYCLFYTKMSTLRLVANALSQNIGYQKNQPQIKKKLGPRKTA